MKKEKVLVCIIAQARTGKFSWKSFKTNVLNHLDADLALCVSEDEEIEKNNPYANRWEGVTFGLDEY